MNPSLVSQDSQGAREKVVALPASHPHFPRVLGGHRLGISKAWLGHTTPPHQKVGKNG